MNPARRRQSWLIVAVAMLMLAGCSTPRPVLTPAPAPAAASRGEVAPAPAASTGAPRRGGGFYMDDGPGDNPPADIAAIPDASPRAEPLLARANKPYVVFGRPYAPMNELGAYRERGVASWYGRKFHGQRTSSGEVYDMYAMTAAHPTLPIPSYAKVTNLRTGQAVVVRVNDRGPFLNGRVIDLSYSAAARLGYATAGSAEVEVELISRFDGLQPAAPLPAAAAAGKSPVTSAITSAALAALPIGSAQAASPGIQSGAPAATPAAGPAVAATAAPSTAPSAATAPAAAPGAISAAASAPAITAPLAAPADGEPRLTLETVITTGGESRNPEPRNSEPKNGEPRTAEPRNAETRGVTSPAAAPTTTAARTAPVYLQLGAFGSRENAEAARSRLARQLDGLTQPIDVLQDGALFKVRTGPFVQREEALAAAERIRLATDYRPFPMTR